MFLTNSQMSVNVSHTTNIKSICFCKYSTEQRLVGLVFGQPEAGDEQEQTNEEEHQCQEQIK